MGPVSQQLVYFQLTKRTLITYSIFTILQAAGFGVGGTVGGRVKLSCQAAPCPGGIPG